VVFGKIEYLNLLPFHVFMKRFVRSSQASMSMNYHKDVPAKTNKKFLSRSVDAAFISSIRAKGRKHVNLGIIAKKEVLSVLVTPNESYLADKESETSNLLAKLLHISGEVLIGDKALRYSLQNKPHIDLAKRWHETYNLPFVFALLCYHKDKNLYKKIEKNFLKKKIKIPRYILNEAASRTQIPARDILHYLTYISYNLDEKAKRGVEKFYKEARKWSQTR
jgi:chorismate dehydratase